MPTLPSSARAPISAMPAADPHELSGLIKNHQR